MNTLPCRTLANTDLELSVLGLGSVKFGRDQQVKYPQHFTIPSDAEVKNLLAQAQELGINYIDTAPAYGIAEQRLGKLLGGQRKRWIIVTKVGEEFIDGQSRYDFSPQHTQTSVERSLRRLATDYLDMVLIHSDGNDLEILQRQGTLEKLAELKRRGLIRAIGISSKTVAGGLEASKHCDAVMVTYNLNERDEAEVIDHAFKNNCGVLIKKAFASGHLSAASGGNQEQSQNQYSAEACLDFVLNKTGVTSAVIGTINPKHLQENVAAAIKVCG